MERLRPPPVSAGPRATLRWVRRGEIAGGIASIVAGAALWDSGWVHWLLLGVGLFGLSPWPGAAAILRRAERHPEVLNHDPERGRARVRRTAPVLVSVCALAGAGVGYLVDGWPAALFMGGLMAASGALGALLALRR